MEFLQLLLHSRRAFCGGIQSPLEIRSIPRMLDGLAHTVGNHKRGDQAGCGGQSGESGSGRISVTPTPRTFDKRNRPRPDRFSSRNRRSSSSNSAADANRCSVFWPMPSGRSSRCHAESSVTVCAVVWLLMQDLMQKQPRLTAERPLSCQQLVQNDSQRVDVAASICMVPFACGLLRRHIRGCAEECDHPW